MKKIKPKSKLLFSTVKVRDLQHVVGGGYDCGEETACYSDSAACRSCTRSQDPGSLQ